MESGMQGFVPPTEVSEINEEMQRKLDKYGRMIKKMEKTLLQDLTNGHPEFSEFQVSISNESIQIYSNTNRSLNARLFVNHSN